MKKSAFHIFNNLGLNRGGLTKSVYKRLNLLSKNFNSILITLDFQKNLLETVDSIRNEHLENNVHVINLFDWILGGDLFLKKVVPHTSKIEHYISSPSIQILKNEKNISARIYENGKFIKYIRFKSNGIIDFIDHMDPIERLRRDEYDCFGILRRTKFFDKKTKECCYEQYFDSTGFCRLAVWLGQGEKPVRYVRFTSSGIVEHSHISFIISEWFYEISSEEDSVFFDEHTTVIHAKLFPSFVRKFAFVHTNHNSNNEDLSDGVFYGVKPIYDNISHLDKIIFLTEQQWKDALSEPSINVSIKNSGVVSHYIQPTKINISRDIKKVVTVSRLALEAKSIDLAIRAFHIVAMKHDDVYYDIYGQGPDFKFIKSLIVELGLENRVRLMGYTSNSPYIFSGAAVSITPSKFEGFGLSILESLASGCPVVAFNVKYGPRDMIVNGDNGFLVDYGDIEGMALAIIECLNKAPSEKMNKFAIESVQKFTLKNHITSLCSITDLIINL